MKLFSLDSADAENHWPLHFKTLGFDVFDVPESNQTKSLMPPVGRANAANVTKGTGETCIGMYSCLFTA